MSVRVMSVVWEWPLPASEKLVALKLADCADDQGRNSYPAVATIAAVCGLTRRGVQKVLRRLEERGCIEAQAGQPTRCATVVYRVRVEAIVTGHDAPPVESEGANVVRPPGELGSQGGRTGFAGGANVVRGGGERGSPDPSVIRPLTVPEQTHTRARDGRRPHPLDETVVLSSKSLAQFDELKAVYPRKDREVAALTAWRALNPSLELGAFIVAHVRVRVNAGWLQQTPLRFVPQLCKFIEERRWQERADAESAAAAMSGAPEGLLTMRCCDVCGESLEGRVVGGAAVYPPCPRCARVGQERSAERRAEQMP